MAVRYSDTEIAALIAERKPLAKGYEAGLQLRPKHGHKQAEMDLTGDEGGAFRLILRQSVANPLDFSVILAFCPPRSNQLFRLCRYNGKSHEHTNKIEGSKIYGFHIHKATERYQALGAKEDAHAELTDRFSDTNGALNCLLEDCGFVKPRDRQGALFP